MVNGIATRVFASFQALIPTSMPAPAVRKLLTLPLDGLPEDMQEREVRLQGVAESIEAIKGVHRVDLDRGGPALRVDYDPHGVSRSRIHHELEFHGLRLASRESQPSAMRDQ